MHAIEAYLLYFTHFTLISLANVAPKKSASPGSEKSHCSEIGLPGCNVHSNGPSIELEWAQSCSENGPYLCSGWHLHRFCTVQYFSTFAPCAPRAIPFHRSQNARWPEKLADENWRENNRLHLAHETLVGPKTQLHMKIFTLELILLTAHSNYGA